MELHLIGHDYKYAAEQMLLTMFPGDEKLILYFEDTKKKMAAQCVVHEALIAELRETYGDDRVALK